MVSLFSHFIVTVKSFRRVETLILDNESVLIRKRSTYFQEKQVLSLAAYVRTEYEDNRLRWDPEQFEDISSLRLPTQRLWLPDLRLYNRSVGFT